MTWARCFEWYFNGDAELPGGGPFKVSQASAGYVRTMWDSIGSMVIGRHLFDLTNGWEGKPPAGEHVVVVSHRPDRTGGTLRLHTTSPTMWLWRSRGRKRWLASVSSRWRRETSVGRRSRWVW